MIYLKRLIVGLIFIVLLVSVSASSAASPSSWPASRVMSFISLMGAPSSQPW